VTTPAAVAESWVSLGTIVRELAGPDSTPQQRWALAASLRMQAAAGVFPPILKVTQKRYLVRSGDLEAWKLGSWKPSPPAANATPVRVPAKRRARAKGFGRTAR
jgi:hypothetical protein